MFTIDILDLTDQLNEFTFVRTRATCIKTKSTGTTKRGSEGTMTQSAGDQTPERINRQITPHEVTNSKRLKKNLQLATGRQTCDWKVNLREDMGQRKYSDSLTEGPLPSSRRPFCDAHMYSVLLFLIVSAIHGEN